MTDSKKERSVDAAIVIATDELEKQLRAKHPRFAAYLDMTITPRKLWGGGFDVLGETYPDASTAGEAVAAAILQKLQEVERQQ